MSKQSDNQFYYFPFNLWIDSLITIFIFISFTFLLVWSINPLYGIIVAIILWSFLWNHFYNMINNLYRNLKGKPALELTETHIYDHINNTKIDWKNVKKIKLWESRGHTFICFNLKNLKSHVKSSKSLFHKILYLLRVYDEAIFIKTEISLVKGKNEVIFERVNMFFKENYKK